MFVQSSRRSSFDRAAFPHRDGNVVTRICAGTPRGGSAEKTFFRA
jgi:hypothetical protein